MPHTFYKGLIYGLGLSAILWAIIFFVFWR